MVTSLISFIVKGNWGLFEYSYNKGSNRNIPFASGAFILVYKSGKGIGYNSRRGNRRDNNIGILKIIGSRYLFFIRVIKPNRIGSLIRSSLVTNISLFNYIYYLFSFIIVYRVFIIVLVLLFYYINILPY